MTSAPLLSPGLVRPRVLLRFFAGLLISEIITSGFASAGNKPTWIELRSPNFIVVTNAGESQARQTAYQFEMIRSVFQYDFNRKGSPAELPLTIIVAKDEDTLKALLPEFWAKRNLAHPAGVFLSAMDTNYIAVRLNVASNSNADQPFEPVYHEYVHYMTRKMMARLPLWLVEGLAEFYGNTQVEGKTVKVGMYSVANLYLLQHKTLLPVETLFAIDSSSPYYHEQDKTSIFYAESWALTHYLFIRDYEEHTQRMPTFVGLLRDGKDPDEAAAKTIGNPESLNEPLRKYVQQTQFRFSPALVPDVDQTKFQVRPMTDAEALAVRADFMAHDHHYKEAQQMLQDALKVDPKLGLAYDGLSSLALQQGNAGEAEKWSSQAIALDPQDYRANYYYAWSLLKAGHTDQESLARAETSLRAVMKGNPEFVPAYDAMACALNLEGGKEKLDEAYAMTLQAVSREPGNVNYRIRAVEVLERQQRPKDAVRVATLAVSMAKTPEEKQAASAALAGAQQFQESWERFQAMQTSQAAGGSKVDSGGVLPTTGALKVTRQVNVSAGIVILSSTEGVDFNSYLNREVGPKIQREWAAQIQHVSAEIATKEGTVIIEFVINRDGSVAQIKLKQSTQVQELDDVVRGAIQSASPFPPLPDKFRGKNIALRFQCEYNMGEHAGSTTAGPGAAAGGKKEVDEKSTKHQ